MTSANPKDRLKLFKDDDVNESKHRRCLLMDACRNEDEISASVMENQDGGIEHGKRSVRNDGMVMKKMGRVLKRPRQVLGRTNETETKRRDPGEGELFFPSTQGGCVYLWNVKDGNEIKRGQVLAKCCIGSRVLGNNRALKDVISPYDGTVVRRLVGEGQELTEGEKIAIAIFTFCRHAEIFAGMCSICGRIASETTADIANNETVTINVDGGNRLKINLDEAKVNQERTVARLLGSRKLSLVIDLDHTLVHATTDLRAREYSQAQHVNDVFEVELEEPGTGGPTGKPSCLKPHFIKLRPVVKPFLNNMSKMFEMYIYTAATRPYAEAVARAIDPDKSVFRDRIISRTDVPELESANEKSLRRIFPVDDTMVIVVDDRSDVWKLDRANLITIKPYRFFLDMRDVNNASGEEFVELTVQKNERDDGLHHVGGLLHWVHQQFYGSISDGALEQLETKDVKPILRRLFGRILRNARVHVDSKLHDPRDEQYFKNLANDMGASIMQASPLPSETTHIVCIDPNSETALWGKRESKWVVNPRWLQACAHNWKHEAESRFSLFPLMKEGVFDAHGKTKKAKAPKRVDEFGYPIENDDDDDDDDDEFINSIEESVSKRK